MLFRSKGPAIFDTLTVTSAEAIWPTEMVSPVALVVINWLSLTVNLNFKSLLTELKASVLAPASPPGRGPLTVLPASIVDSCGNRRVGEVVGWKEIQLGPEFFAGEATLLEPVCEEEALSSCSQQ